MKTRLMILAEIVLFIVFVGASIVTKLKIVRLGFVAIPAFVILGALYFPLGSFTLRSGRVNSTYAGLYGLLFSLSLAAIFFSILKSSFTVVLLLIFITVFLALAVVAYFFNKPDRKVLPYDTASAARYVILLISMIVALIVFV